MADVSKKLEKGQLLFREGDASDSMYVVKKGRIAITKTKGDSEVELANMGPGQMFGEMAFFDQKPRSANARAMAESEIIALPFANLEAHFKAMPEWLKSMVKTINEHLREANKKIKILEKAQGADSKTFPPHTITKLCAIIGLVTERYGEKDDKGLVVPTTLLRNYTIQVFQEPTTKMEKMQQILQSIGVMTVEDLGEGKKKITILKHDFIMSFVEFYNDWLFKEESKRILVEEKDLPILKALLFYGRKQTPDDKGQVKVSLNAIQNESMKDLGYVVSLNDYASVIDKKLVGEKSSEKDGVAISYDFKMLDRIFPFWELIYIIDKYDRS
ncbi:MAG: cyclic nucleotide-binding domain-containing protein, partial [Bdellovibrionota bacterium]